MRIALALLVSCVLAVFSTGCGPEVCAFGPSFIEPVALSAAPGQPIDERLSLSPGGAADGVTFRSVQSDDLPTGLTAAIEGDVLRLSGNAPAVEGTHPFVIVLQEEAGDACAPWARYDVSLAVAR